MVEESTSSVPVPLLCLTSKICAEHYWGQAHTRLTQIPQCVRGHLGRILDVFCRQVGSKLAVPPIQRVTGQQVEWDTLGLYALDHLQAQRDLRLKAALWRDPQLSAPLRKGFPKPLFR
jgi:hypothetical protein